MSTTMRRIGGGSERLNGAHPAGPVPLGSAWRARKRATWWTQHREASLNWLALGMLLAAWNASDSGPVTPVRRRPDSLRGYSAVSVRAAAIHSANRRTSSSTAVLWEFMKVSRY